jgi:hypothetical protein
MVGKYIGNAAVFYQNGTMFHYGETGNNNAIMETNHTQSILLSWAKMKGRHSQPG